MSAATPISPACSSTRRTNAGQPDGPSARSCGAASARSPATPYFEELLRVFELPSALNARRPRWPLPSARRRTLFSSSNPRPLFGATSAADASAGTASANDTSQRTEHCNALHRSPHPHDLAHDRRLRAMAAAGIVAVIEPAFWLGQPRTKSAAIMDYLSQHRRLGAFPRRSVRHPALLRDRSQHQGGQQRSAGRGGARDAAALCLARKAWSPSAKSATTSRPRSRTNTSDRSSSWPRSCDMPVMIHTPASRQEDAAPSRSMDMAIEHGSHRAAWSSITTTRRRCRKCSIAASGRRSRSIRTPRWATSAWSRSCARYGSERHLRRFQLRLGRVRSAGGAEDGDDARPSAASRRRTSARSPTAMR